MKHVAVASTAGLPPSRPAVAERCYAAGFHALADGDLESGARWFALLTLLEPRRERSWAGLAVAHERGGRLPLALTLYALGQQLSGASAWLELGRARTLRALGHARPAEQAFDRARTLTDETTLARAIEEERCPR